MRISNIEWLKKRIGFIRKLGEQTARQRQIIDLIDNEAGLTEQGIERRPEVHLGFEAAGRLDDAQRHDIMQKRSEPDYSRHLE
ncbi:hypothetical protein ACSLNR_29275, partial [Escherichia coli]